MKPAFEYGTEVRVTRNLRNDGTYPGEDVGKLLVKRGSIGAVYDVGTYLQDQLIYRVHFLEAGKMVGCRQEELILASDPWLPSKFEFNQKVRSLIPIELNGELAISTEQVGSVAKVVKDMENLKVNYHVYFSGRTFSLPEGALTLATEEIQG